MDSLEGVGSCSSFLYRSNHEVVILNLYRGCTHKYFTVVKTMGWGGCGEGGIEGHKGVRPERVSLRWLMLLKHQDEVHEHTLTDRASAPLNSPVRKGLL